MSEILMEAISPPSPYMMKDEIASGLPDCVDVFALLPSAF